MTAIELTRFESFAVALLVPVAAAYIAIWLEERNQR